MKLTASMMLTLDGVYQGPGGPEEDRAGGFDRGGWTAPFADEEGWSFLVNWFERADAFLLGRTTYEIFADYWPRVTDPDNPIAGPLNRLPKYVASTTLSSVDWTGASLLEGDVVAAVTELKKQPGRELQVHGSGRLAHTLIRHNLVDEYRLQIFPIHLGTGLKLFAEGLPAAALTLTSSHVTGGGTIIVAYEPAGPVTYGSYALEDE